MAALTRTITALATALALTACSGSSEQDIVLMCDGDRVEISDGRLTEPGDPDALELPFDSNQQALEWMLDTADSFGVTCEQQ